MSEQPPPPPPIEQAPQGPAPARPTPRSRKRAGLIVAGFVVLLGGALYAWWAEQNSDVNRGWKAYLRGEYDQAIAHFTRALQGNPRSADAYVGRSWARLNKLGEAEPDTAGRTEREQAEAAAARKTQFEEALADSTQALRLDPDSAKAYAARGKALAGLKRLPEAMKDLDEAVRRNPRGAWVYYARAQLANTHAVQGASPLEDVEQSIRLDPSFAPAHALRGHLYLRRGQFEETVRSCNRALELDPKLAPAYLYRGDARRALGQEREGSADIERARRLDPQLRRTEVGLREEKLFRR
jgi:tetratricopeptide (TPR) repeat protein